MHACMHAHRMLPCMQESVYAKTSLQGRAPSLLASVAQQASDMYSEANRHMGNAGLVPYFGKSWEVGWVAWGGSLLFGTPSP